MELKHLALNVSWEMDSGILAIDSDKPVGGIFFTKNRYERALLINVAWVDIDFRRRGIYTQLHRLTDEFAKLNSKTEIYSYIHVDNHVMNQHVVEKIGYKPVMTLYSRKVSDEAQR